MMAKLGVSRTYVSYFFSTFALISSLLSVVMPFHHIPYEGEAGKDVFFKVIPGLQVRYSRHSICNWWILLLVWFFYADPEKRKTYEVDRGRTVSLMQSLRSLSSLLHLYWFFICLFAINVYQQNYNVWVTGRPPVIRLYYY